MKRRSDIFLFLMAMHKYLGDIQKECQRIEIKFINYFQGFHVIAILEIASKYDFSNSKENTNRGVQLQRIQML